MLWLCKILCIFYCSLKIKVKKSLTKKKKFLKINFNSKSGAKQIVCTNWSKYKIKLFANEQWMDRFTLVWFRLTYLLFIYNLVLLSILIALCVYSCLLSYCLLLLSFSPLYLLNFFSSLSSWILCSVLSSANLLERWLVLVLLPKCIRRIHLLNECKRAWVCVCVSVHVLLRRNDNCLTTRTMITRNGRVLDDIVWILVWTYDK